MRLWLMTIFAAVLSLPWRRPTPDEVIRDETGSPPGPIRSAPLRPALMTMRFGPPKPSATLPHRRGIH